VSANGVKKMAKSLSLRETTGNCVIRTKIKKRKVIVIGDSHARGLAAELSASLGKSFEVMSTIMPGTGLRHITGLASRETSQLQHDEFVIICGGANDINKNESNIGLRNIRKFALQNKHTNVITISPPQRHDLQDSFCINGEIQVFMQGTNLLYYCFKLGFLITYYLYNLLYFNAIYVL